MQAELAAIERFSQPRFQGKAARRPLVQVLGEEPVLVAAVFLGVVHRRIGVLQDLFRIGPVLGEHADADAGGHGDLVVREPDGDHQALGDPVRHHGCGLGGGNLAQDDDELVAAVAGDGLAAGDVRQRRLVPPRDLIGGAHRGLQPLRHLPQQAVAGVVTKGVVDPLEVVDVQEQDGDDALMPGRVRQRVIQHFAHEGAVG